MMVPVEFLGRARAFRSMLVADHAAAIAMLDRLVLPLRGRFRLRQQMSGRTRRHCRKRQRTHE
jgi:hypothetical protein